MSAPTFSHPGEWDGVLASDVAHSQRATTSSRRPGALIRGTVTYRRHEIAPCPDCGVLRRGDGPHAPRWWQLDGVWAVRDCAGREVV
jgi:hypothetical protein